MPTKFAFLFALCLMPLVVIRADESFAQSTEPDGTTQAKPKRDKYGSPFDTLMTTHLWTDVPPAHDFVKQSRPDMKTLDYEPLTGADPDRPKARDSANLSALRAELEGDAVKNERKARALRPALKPRAKQAAPRS